VNTSLPVTLKHSDGRTYRVTGVEPFRVEVLKQDGWKSLRGNPDKLREIWRAFQRVTGKS
jgi:hypothetical protein